MQHAEKVAQFTRNIQTWELDRVLNYFARCMGDNGFGVRDEEIAVVRAEIHRRVPRSLT